MSRRRVPSSAPAEVPAPAARSSRSCGRRVIAGMVVPILGGAALALGAPADATAATVGSAQAQAVDVALAPAVQVPILGGLGLTLAASTPQVAAPNTAGTGESTVGLPSGAPLGLTSATATVTSALATRTATGLSGSAGLATAAIGILGTQILTTGVVSSSVACPATGSASGHTSVLDLRVGGIPVTLTAGRSVGVDVGVSAAGLLGAHIRGSLEESTALSFRSASAAGLQATLRLEATTLLGAPVEVALGSITLAGTACTAPDAPPVTPPTGAAPRTTRNPVDTAVSAGQQVGFSAAATGSPTPAVQWQRAAPGSSTFTAIPGARQTSYRTPPVGTGAAGTRYRAVFSNSHGSATTRAATVAVHALKVTAFRVPMGIRVGAVRVAIPFSVTTNGPAGTVTVTVVRNSTGKILAATSVRAATSRQVDGVVRFAITSAHSYGAYRWVVTAGHDKGTTLTRAVRVQANAELVVHARRSGSLVEVTGRARRWDVTHRVYQWWGGQHVTVQERISGTWRAVRTVTTSHDGALAVRLHATRGAQIRLIVHPDGITTGRTSNTVGV